MHLVDTTIFYPAQAGGVRTYLSAKSRWLAKHARIRHTVVAPVYPQRIGDADYLGVPGFPIPFGKGYRMPFSIRAAEKAIARLEPDLIEVGDAYVLAWAALRAGKRLQVPVIAFYHSDLPRIASQRFGATAERAVSAYTSWLYRKFDLVLAPSAGVAEKLHSLGVERVALQPLGVDTTAFTPARRSASLRQTLGLDPATRLLVYAGRFTREKKLDILVDAVERLGQPYHLLLIGAGDAPRPSPQVTCLPFQADVEKLAEMIAGCDALVHAGDQETFGLVVLEAMACGLPVVGVNASGVAELVDPDTGVLVSPGCPHAFAEGIASLYRLDRAALGAAARRKVVERYGWDSVLPQLASRYDDVLAAQRRGNLKTDTSYVIE